MITTQRVSSISSNENVAQSKVKDSGISCRLDKRKMVDSFFYIPKIASPVTVAGIVTKLRSGVWIPVEARYFLFSTIVETGSGVRSACCWMGAGFFSGEVKFSIRLHFSAEVKNEWRYTLLPPLRHGLVNVHRYRNGRLQSIFVTKRVLLMVSQMV